MLKRQMGDTASNVCQKSWPPTSTSFFFSATRWRMALLAAGGRAWQTSLSPRRRMPLNSTHKQHNGSKCVSNAWRAVSARSYRGRAAAAAAARARKLGGKRDARRWRLTRGGSGYPRSTACRSAHPPPSCPGARTRRVLTAERGACSCLPVHYLRAVSPRVETGLFSKRRVRRVCAGTLCATGQSTRGPDARGQGGGQTLPNLQRVPFELEPRTLQKYLLSPGVYVSGVTNSGGTAAA
jgi:hypothetical protein